MKKKVITILAFMVLLFPGFIRGAIPAEERAILIALYNSTDGDNWGNNLGWKTPPLDTDGFAMPGTERDWYGVTVSDDHVTELCMYRNGLKGSIPPQLGNLSKLKTLNFNLNYSLGGCIPPELGNLGNLILLNLDGSFSGSIPPELGKLKNLTWLTIEGYSLSGAIPSQLGNLTNLRYLNLSLSQLSGAIPPQLGNLSKLEELHLQRTQLSGSIPPELGNLSNLYFLGLNDNQLSRALPPQLGNLSRLQELYLKNNQLSGSIPPEWGNLRNLKYFEMSHNQLSGNIPSQLGNLSSLQELYLTNNQLSGSIPPELGKMSNLQYLYLDHNQLNGAIPPQLANISHLYRLNLGFNQLDGEIPPELGNLPELSFLELNNNQFSGNIPYQLGNLTEYLSRLNLGWNRLSGNIPWQLSNLSHLSSLTLSGNQLSGHIPSQLGNMNLWELYLDHNQLSGGIPGNFNKFHILNLSFNQLSGSIPPELFNQSSISFLNLSFNHLSGEIPIQIGNLYYLMALYLNDNRLSGAIPSCFINNMHISPYNAFDIGYNCLHAEDPALRVWLDSHDPDWEAHQNQCTANNSEISLNRSQLNFGAITPGGIPGAQTVLISNSGGSALNWAASGNAAWLSFTPSSGTDNSVLSAAVNPAGLAKGNYTGSIIITDPNASNSPQAITVSLHVYDQGETSAPFGEFDTPSDGSFVCNSIPVTGWVLDDIGIANVKIYNDDTYIGDAIFVEGARPDIEATYSTYPNSYKAGWGYMLLTNFLPNGGNGTYTLIAKATDIEGNETVLGSKTITIDNVHAVKPFGAIDTPTQGGTTSGKNFMNYGWALTPQPNTIPVDGSTINVVIDGVVKGHPVYNVFRSDIASLFPGYANTNGAVGYYYLDTTKLTNGVHTIAWTVTDNDGNSDGIGSRYFTVQNSGNSGVRDQGPGAREKRRGAPTCAPFFDSCAPFFDSYLPVFDETKIVEIKELERVEINLSDEGVIEGYLVVGDQLRGLPIGSTLNRENGIFYWQPGPGFIGDYRFVFSGMNEHGDNGWKNIVIRIKPKYMEK